MTLSAIGAPGYTVENMTGGGSGNGSSPPHVVLMGQRKLITTHELLVQRLRDWLEGAPRVRRNGYLRID